MVSTLEKDMRFENGMMRIVPKEYPNWYGINDIGFIWRGTQSDPLLEYKGKRYNSCLIENTMWELYNEDNPTPKDYNSNEYKEYENKFEFYMKENDEIVKELLTELS